MRKVDLVLGDMMKYVQNMRKVRGMGPDVSDHYVVLYKSILVDTWVIRRGEINEDSRIRSEKLIEHKYKEGYARCLKSKRAEWGGGRNVEQM